MQIFIATTVTIMMLGFPLFLLFVFWHHESATIKEDKQDNKNVMYWR